MHHPSAPGSCSCGPGAVGHGSAHSTIAAWAPGSPPTVGPKARASPLPTRLRGTDTANKPGGSSNQHPGQTAFHHPNLLIQWHSGEAAASIRLEDRLCAIRVENLACPCLIIRAAFLSFALCHVECRPSSNARATLTCTAAGNYPCRTLIEVGKHNLAIVRTRGRTFAKGFLLRSTLPSLPCRHTCIRSSLGCGNCTPGGDPFSRRLWRRNGSGHPAIVCSRDRRTALYSLSSDRIHTRGAVALRACGRECQPEHCCYDHLNQTTSHCHSLASDTISNHLRTCMKSPGHAGKSPSHIRRCHA